MASLGVCVSLFFDMGFHYKVQVDLELTVFMLSPTKCEIIVHDITSSFDKVLFNVS